MIVLSGKTCSGKNFIRDLLKNEGIDPVVTYTTRPMREGEIDGKTYHYLSQEEFQQKLKDGFFVEFTKYQAPDGEARFYGSHFSKEDDNKVIILNPDGIDALRNSSQLEVTPVIFYIDTPDSLIRERAVKRGDNSQEVEQRLKQDNIDFKGITEKADIVVRNDGGLKPESLINVILNYHNCVLKQTPPSPWKAPSASEKEMQPSKFDIDKTM